MDKRPNIILIMTDQQRYDTIGTLGYPHVHTPHLDRLAREGVVFENCFITAPSCCPSRCSFFTGYYPHNTGVYKNGDQWSEGWVASLADAGYHCVNVGKMHTVPFTAKAGFHERYPIENKDRFMEGRYFFDEWDKALAARGLVKQQRETYRQRADYHDSLGAFVWEMGEENHSDVFTGQAARWWLKSFPQTEPLFLEVGFPGPHPPYDPVPRWIDHYKGVDLPLQPVNRTDLDGQPAAMRDLREHMEAVDHDSVVHEVNAHEGARAKQRAYYMANVSMIDEQIGLLLDTLGEQGYLENTVIIFCSDHGDCLGDHGHSQKWSMYEQVVRVPAIIWAPAQAAGGVFSGGRKITDLYQLMDLGATILDLAGVPGPEDSDAVSMLPAVTGQGQAVHAASADTADPAGNPPAGNPPAGRNDKDTGHPLPLAADLADTTVSVSDSQWDNAVGYPPFVTNGSREYVFAEHGKDNILSSETMVMVRSRSWKLVYFSDSGEGQLFCLDTDPAEEVNLWNDPAHAHKKTELMQVLAEWYVRSSYRTRKTRRGKG